MVGGTDSFSYTGDPAGTISTQDGTITEAVAPGSQYVSTEAAKAGWDLTDVSCDNAHGTGDKAARTATFNPVAGETITCTFTNTKQATITVKKVTVPAGDPATFGFSGDITATLGDTQSADASVVPGTYHVTEAAKTGWDLTSVVCNDEGSSGDKATGTATFVVAAGQHVTCTYTNTKRATIVVKKHMVGGTDSFVFTG